MHLLLLAAGWDDLVARLRALDRLFGTDGELPDGTNTATTARDRAAIARQFVRSRLQDDRFYETVLPLLYDLFGTATNGVKSFFTPLKPVTVTTTTLEGQRVLCEGQYGQLLAPATCRCGAHLLSCVPAGSSSTTVRTRTSS